MGASKDIQLVFGVALGEGGSPNSADVIKEELQGIVDTLNKNPFKVAFTIDEKSLESIKSQLSSITNSLNVQVTQNAASASSTTTNTQMSANAAEKAKKAADANNELATAVANESKAEEQRKISLKDFLSMYTTLSNIKNSNGTMWNASDPSFIAARDVLADMERAYAVLVNETTEIDDITIKVGNDIVDVYTRGKVAIEQMNAASARYGDGANYDSVVKKITQIHNLLQSNPEMEMANPERWNKLTNIMNYLESTIDRTRNTFVQFNTDFGLAPHNIASTLKNATAEIENFKMAIPVNSKETNAFEMVATQVDKISKLLGGKSKFKSTDEYQQLYEIMVNLNDMLDRTNGKLTAAASEIEGDGTRVSKAMEQSTRAVGAFNYVVNTTEKEAAETSINLEKLITQTTAWYKAKMAASKEGITSTNNADMKTLSESLSYFDKFRLYVKQFAGDDISKALSRIGVTSVEVKNKIIQTNIAMKDLNRTVLNLKNNEVSANATEKEKQAALLKTYSLLNQVQSALKNWDKASTGKSSGSYNQIKEYSLALENIIKRFNTGSISAEEFNREINKIKVGFKSHAAIIKENGENMKSFSSSIVKVARNFSMWFSLSSIIMRTYRNIKELISASIELDDAMTQLKIVTNESEEAYRNFGNTIADVAKRTASSVSDITSSVTTYARLGYSLEEATKIAEYTAKLQNVGDIDVSDAQDAITAILKAYDGIDADSIEDIMNKLVVTGNNFPISVSQIAEGMNNASSALSAAGNTFEQSVALLTAANTTIQDAAKSSTALRTIAARIRKTDSELEDLGEAMTSSKYDSLVKGLTDLDIALVDLNGDYRSTYDILADIASKWDSMSSMEQAALADAIAGTRQQSVFYSLIGQFQEASGAMDAMANSANVLTDAYSTYLDSTTAHINQFKAAKQELASDFFSTGFLNWVIDIGKAFVEFADAITKAKLRLTTLGVALTITKLIKWRSAVAASTAQTRTLTASLLVEKGANDNLAVSIAALNKEQLKKVRTGVYDAYVANKITYEEYEQIKADLALIASETGLEAENKSLATSFLALGSSIPGWGWFLIVLTAVTAAIGALTQSVQNSGESFKESATNLNEQVSALENYKSRIQEIVESEDDLTKKMDDLDQINQELNDGYGIRIGNIKDETEYVTELNKQLDQEILNKKKLYDLDNEAAYEESVSKSTDFKNGDGFWKRHLKDWWDGGRNEDLRVLMNKTWAGSGYFRTENISDNIMDLFEYDADKNLISIGNNAKNESELLGIIQDAYIKYGDIIKLREAAGNELTSDERDLYKTLQSRYFELNDHLGEDGINYDQDIAFAKNRAETLMLEYKQGTRSLAEWEEYLVKLANDDELVIEQIHTMIEGLKEVDDVDITDPFTQLSTALEEIEGKLETFKESISTVSDYFDDMVKVIDKNKETDKFFTADEMIDMLEKYPELNDAVLVTAYGYKFEEKALEDLREAKLKEQKDDLYTKLVETQTALDAADKKVAAYREELDGIENLADAEMMLAAVEAELATIDPTDGKAEALETQRAKISNYIDAYNKAATLRQDYEKSVMQYTVLGNVFDDLKDSTSDATSALNAQKSAMKDLNDEYKDAQDAIEDLVKLTMDMIV